MNRDIELLSSYLDGELSPEEIKLLEEKLSFTPALRDKLAELKRLKELTSSSINKIPEAPYFETRLFAELENPNKSKIKKWSPVIGFAVLTIALMLVLKFNPDFIKNVFEEQKSNLAGFYKENLKPLLFAADLSNEDIFNFAFYKQLPLDNTKTQYIKLGSDPSGDEYFEISTAGLISQEGNLKKFIETLGLNENQKQQFDSIMGSYAVALQSQILVNDKNTVAISPNLWNYQKAIVADILSFAKGRSKDVNDAIPVIFKVESPFVKQVVHSVKTNDDNEYIFFTPDSLFIDTFEFDNEKFQKEMEIAEKEMQKSYREIERNHHEMQEFDLVKLKLDSSLIKLRRAPRVDNNINIFIDSNICRVQIDKIEIPNIELPDMENLEAIINEATKQYKAFTYSVPLPDHKSGKNFKKYEDKIEVRNP
ncbi:MAG TPA: zf-HC2 domain-containing protein, partial [Ignavibacteriaceae bacterium]|nr:zf-HC2 domain-containing protein [Ignavibacteriaceae bacterium]